MNELQNELEKAGFNTVDLTAPTEKRAGAVWDCKIGVLPENVVNLPGGADSPMRDAVAKAFKDITGEDCEFIFSGWGGKLSKYEEKIVRGED